MRGPWWAGSGRESFPLVVYRRRRRGSVSGAVRARHYSRMCRPRHFRRKVGFPYFLHTSADILISSTLLTIPQEAPMNRLIALAVLGFGVATAARADLLPPNTRNIPIDH